MRHTAAALACALAAAPCAQGAALQLEIGSGLEFLTGNYSDWHGSFVETSWIRAPHKVLYGAVRTTERFDLHDTELLIGAYHPLYERWTLLLETNTSTTHAVLPRGSSLVQIEHALTAGFGTQLGLRHTQYNNAWANQVIVTLERYYGNQYTAYTVYTGQLEGGGTPTSQRLQWRYNYNDASHVGLSYARGIEVENLSFSRTLTSDVRTAVLTARHQLTPDWAVSFELLHHQQGASYLRRGLRLGLRFQY